MDAPAIHQRLSAVLGDAIVEVNTDGPDPWISIRADAIADAGKLLRDEPDLAFDFLESISGVDTGEHLWCVYHVFSYKHRHGIALRVKTSYDQVAIPTLSEVWPAAEWHEREQYDLFGFEFLGHRDLRRILLPEDWVGHPLRKSYEYPDEYHGIDHYRPDPKAQFKALDELAAKAAAKVREQQEAKAVSDKAESEETEATSAPTDAS